MVNKFKRASKIKLRVATNRGNLSVEQLWDLSIEDLDSVAVTLDTNYRRSAGKSFINKSTTKDRTIKLALDVVLDILETKVAERDKLTKAREDRAHNEKIYAAIAELEDNELKSMSKKELLAQIR